MRILIDTNIIMDYIGKREPFLADARMIIKLCTEKSINGCISSHTITNLFYILRKELSAKDRRTLLLKLTRAFPVIGIDYVKLEDALKNDVFEDLEDCLQDECAKEFYADYIVTRNIKDFVKSSIKAIEPHEFLEKIGYSVN